jgi:hypothetical protein
MTSIVGRVSACRALVTSTLSEEVADIEAGGLKSDKPSGPETSVALGGISRLV